MSAFDDEGPGERLAAEAEELMRQHRFRDAAERYLRLRRDAPTDLWASLGHASALECAGQVTEARQVLDEAARQHRESRALNRFRHLFFVRREDLRAAAACRQLLSVGLPDAMEADQLADLYFNQGRYHEAQSELERLLADGVEEPAVRAGAMARLGACLRQNGDPAAARDRLLQALALEEGSHWTLSELAETERALGDADAARKRYLEALEQNGDDQWTRGHLAQLEHEQGQSARAVLLYEEILRQDAKLVWAKVELAQVLTESDPARSLALAREAIEQDPTNPWAHAHLGALARRAGTLDEALACYQRAAEASPQAVWVLHELADVCRHLGRLPEAYAHLDHARAQEPYHSITHGYYADLLRGEGRTAEALAHLEKAVDLDAQYVWAWRELAEIHAIAGRHPRAEECYQHACDIDGEVAMNDGLKAFLLRCQDRRDAGIPWLERATERQNDYLWAWRELTETHLTAGRSEAAVTVATAGLKACGDSAPLMGLLAEAERRLGRKADGLAHVNRALELTAEPPQLHAIRAELLAESEDLAGAALSAREAVRRDPAGEYRCLLAQILIAQGDAAGAWSQVEALVVPGTDFAPAFEVAAAAAERLGRVAEAHALCQRGVAGPARHDPRLAVRLARLDAAAGDLPAATQRCLDLMAFPPGAPVAWREVAQTLAAGGRPLDARRAVLRLVDQAEHRQGDRAGAWIAVAELALGQGEQDDAAAALERGRSIDPEHPTGRLVAAVLAEGQGDLLKAVAELEALDARLAARSEGSDPLLLRQLALVHERRGDQTSAGAAWNRLLNHAAASDLHRAEHAAWLLRRDLRTDGLAAAEPLWARLDSSSSELQRLLREAAMAELRANGAAAGADLLGSHLPLCGVANRTLHLGLLLSAGRNDEALAGARAVLVEHPQQRAAGLLTARALLSLRQLNEAAVEARRWRDTDASDDETATVLAECLAMAGHHDEALAEIEDPRLPARPGRERGLLWSLLLLEVRGPEAFFALRGRLGDPDAAVPMMRALAAAWPVVWGRADGFAPGDVLSLPPFPRAAAHVARALVRQGHHLAAAELLTAVAKALDDPRQARRLRWQAIPALWRTGRYRMLFAALWE